MALPARLFRDAVSGRAPRPGSPRGTPALPPRDWKRAFALVDALRSEYRGAPWFRGIRAVRDRATEAIRIEVEVDGESLPGALPARLLALGVSLRRLGYAGASAAAL